MERNEEYLNKKNIYMKVFHNQSEIQCNVSKTKITPIEDFDMVNKLCPKYNL